MINKRLEHLRKCYEKHEIDGYIIGSSDEYLNEYVPEHAKRLEYITGFNGSNGLAVILSEVVLFFTDGRYLTQCSEQLDSNIFKVHNIADIGSFDWEEYISAPSLFGYDPKLFSSQLLKAFKGLNLKAIQENLIDAVWEGQPDRPNSAIYKYSEKYAGLAAASKLESLRENLKKEDVPSVLITDPASVCWLLNIRAADVEFSPLLLAHAFVDQNTTYLFADRARFEFEPEDLNLKILPEDTLEEFLMDYTGKIMYDSKGCNSFIDSILKSRGENAAKDAANPLMLDKAIKNETEISWAKKGHVQDAVAVCEMLSFIAANDVSNYSEYDISRKLTKLRSGRNNYVYDSFPAICGFAENGAVIHYKPEQESALKLNKDGLLLIDSGGQYLGATTDITRVIAIGDIKPEYKKFYTLVLKGHIALSNARFPKGRTSGANLDLLARQYLWQEGVDYAHGTGHGVGSFLSVHEGPQNISLRGAGVALQAGMILSNEPGYYEPGHFGIRIENLMHVKESDHDGFLEFENLTLVPYAKDLIDFSMLSIEETQYLKEYYSEIKQQIVPLLSADAKAWVLENIDIKM